MRHLQIQNSIVIDNNNIRKSTMFFCMLAALQNVIRRGLLIPQNIYSNKNILK